MQRSDNNEKPTTLIEKIKRKIRWRNFIKDTLKLVDVDMKDQQAVTIKKVTDEMAKMDLPPASEMVLRLILQCLKENSTNLKALRTNYGVLKNDLVKFFGEIEQHLGVF